jgi:predicted nucleic acid-binding protein
VSALTAVDTNVVVRLLTADEPDQHSRAVGLFREADQILIPTTVVLESEWVLRYAYDFAPTEIAPVLRRLFGLPNVLLEHPLRLARALSWHEAGLDFADALHLAATGDDAVFYTFDRDLVKRVTALDGPVVKEPEGRAGGGAER